MAAAAIMDLENVNNIELNLHQTWWADASRPCGDDTWPFWPKVETGS